MKRDRYTYKVWNPEMGAYTDTRPPFSMYLHSEAVPSILEYDAGKLIGEIWYVEDSVHRTDAPAQTNYYSIDQDKVFCEKWMINGFFHRDNDPAHVEYWLNGKIKMMAWYKEGALHNELGPAKIEYNVMGKTIKETWALHNKKLDKNEWQGKLLEMKLVLI